MHLSRKRRADDAKIIARKKKKVIPFSPRSTNSNSALEASLSPLLHQRRHLSPSSAFPGCEDEPLRDVERLLQLQSHDLCRADVSLREGCVRQDAYGSRQQERKKLNSVLDRLVSENPHHIFPPKLGTAPRYRRPRSSSSVPARPLRLPGSAHPRGRRRIQPGGNMPFQPSAHKLFN